MNQLTKVNSLSIAELRKILKDNDIKDTSTDKEDLIYQVTDVLLTNMAIQDMMEYDTIIPFEKTINENVKPDPNTILREEQDREYIERLEMDQKVLDLGILLKKHLKNYHPCLLEKNDWHLPINKLYSNLI